MSAAWFAAAIVTGVGVCVVDELNATPESGGVPTKMRICYMVPGNMAWDSCECGQFAQSIQADYPSDRFPTDASNEPIRAPCGARSTGFQVIASIVRCVPGPQQNGAPPTCTSLLAAALVMEGDAYALRRGIECCLAEYKRTLQIADYRVGRANRVGPEGNCAGVELQYWFQVV